MDADVELLNFVYQNSQMGQHSIHQLLDATKDDILLNHLNTQLEEYNRINKEAKTLLHERGYEEKDISKMAKISSSMSINMKTMMDNSTTHIAEMMLQGSTIGIIDMTKKIKNYPNSDDKIVDLAHKLLRTEESNIEHLKAFLA